MMDLTLTNVVKSGNAIVEATVNNIQATDVLQAELIAERFLNFVVKENGEVNSTDRWELEERVGTTYAIKFSAS